MSEAVTVSAVFDGALKCMSRRVALRLFGVSAVAVACLGASATALHAAVKKRRWRMALAWTGDMQMFKDGAFRFARQVSLLSESRLAIDVDVASAAMLPLTTLDRVASGEVDCAHVFLSYFAEREPAFEWFTSVPFGLDAAGMSAWLYAGGGDALLAEIAREHGVYAVPMGDVGQGMFGWLRRDIHEAKDFSGQTFPAWGMAGQVLSSLGARTSEKPLVSGADIASSFASGALDGAWWHGPHQELALGMDANATVYAGPGWQCPAGRMVLIINRKAYEALPPALQRIIDACAMQEDSRLLADFRAANMLALSGLTATRPALLRRLPDEILSELHDAAQQAQSESAARGKNARRVAESYLRVLERLGGWRRQAMVAGLP